MMDVLHWSGGRNVRDLGGRALRAGGCTAFGKVFRSAAPEHLTDAGWAAAKAAGVRTVVDLRNAPAETQRRAEHPIISAESLQGLVFVPAPTEDPDDTEFLRVCGPFLDHPRCWADNTRLAPDRISAALRAVARADGAVLVHCAGGRDRTGMISAMLLHIAGATDHAIIDDYAAGWRGAAAHAGHAWVYDPGQGNWREHQQEPTAAEDVERQLTDRTPALREWIATFDATDLLAPDELRAIRALLTPAAP
ncbi:tyrosine-protein phosphatase [Dactylosporangium sp. CA-139066]|uniref:tyrosine-protein phosphatase n=1 Tax=Dactylosporangium sp. CA-139066 TaxID=3239930 RepID=UPI003D92E319